ncbi:MAG TPA: glycoside hydrolase family 3 C-terminal domain-containing protein [Rhizomicrobium sp.]|nr:glycoside hydrolase family 3 C-terminal domain-containing protein [Rhizomicrobium sp.]
MTTTAASKFRNSALPLEERVEDLLGQMTLEEKVTLMAGAEAFALHGVPRLDVPGLKLTDGPTGVRSNAGKPATVFPVAVSLAATWSPEMAREVAAAIAREARALGEVAILAPTINIVRTPVWGRNFETYSEDPHLTAQVAIEYVKGMQAEGIGTSLKHYAANNQEENRFTVSAEMDERTLREMYLAAFEDVVREANPWTVMASYNKINGIWAAENRKLLTEILKDEWGYDGVVVSDWGAVHSTAPSANAGLDLEMPGPARYFGDKLIAAVKAGEVSEAQVTDAARRMVRFILRTGALDGKPIQPGEILSERHRDIARRAAEEGTVLLKNDGKLLPFDPKAIKTLAVIGPNAESFRMQGDGSSRVQPSRRVTLLESLQAMLPDTRIEYEQGADNEPTPPVALPTMFSTDAMRSDQGLKAEHYGNSDLSGEPERTRVERRFFRYIGASAQGKPVTGSYRWHGYFWPETDGEYEFAIRGRGPGTLTVDGKLLIDENSPVILDPADLTGRPNNLRTGKMTLEAGRGVQVELTFAWPEVRELEYMSLGVRVPSRGVDEAVALAKRADAVVVVIGSASTTEGEGYDRQDMEFPGNQNALVAAILAANPKTVICVNSGSPMTMPWVDQAKAVVLPWLPGEEGPNALARVLFGASAPSGRLPVTFPRKYEDNPAFGTYDGGAKAPYAEGLGVGYRHFDGKNISPLFAFGHGLTYTTFAYSELKAPETARGGQALQVQVRIANTGTRKGQETVQIYVQPQKPTLPSPVKTLRGFAKVELEPGEEKTVTVTLSPRSFSYYDGQAKTWAVDPGEYIIHAAMSASDVRHSRVVKVS